MITGLFVLEDITLSFNVVEDGTVNYTVTDTIFNETETLSADQYSFFAALSIAVHNDGNPDAKRDYPHAVGIMENIRWIP